LHNLLATEAFLTGRRHEVVQLGDETAALRRACDRDTSTTPELEKSLLAKDAERTEDGVDVHAQHGGKVLGGREPLARTRLAVGE
jgi:hypothetical protein